MNKINYPGFDQEQRAQRQIQEAQEKKLAIIAQKKEAKKAKRQKRRRQIKEYAPGIPLLAFKHNVPNELHGIAICQFFLTFCTSIIYLLATNELHCGIKPDCFKTVWAIWGGSAAIYALIWVIDVLKTRSAAIYDAIQSIERKEYSENLSTSYRLIDITKSPYWCIYPAFRELKVGQNGILNHYQTADDLERHIWNKHFSTDPLYFDSLIKLFNTPIAPIISISQKSSIVWLDKQYIKDYEKQCRSLLSSLCTTYATGMRAIIENHLKTHPSDIKQIKKTFYQNTIPKKLLERYDNQR